MQNNAENISVAEAKATLTSLGEIEKDTKVYLRMLLWLNGIISAAYGMGVFSWASTRHENLWMLGVIISVVVFILAIAMHFYSSRLLGVKPKLVPKSRAELLFGLLLGIFFAAGIAFTRIFSENGIWWASYTGGAIAALVLAYVMHCYPTGDYKKGTSLND